MTTTRKVEFLRDTLYEQGGVGKGHKFLKGQVHEFEEDFAQRWVRRGDARLLDAEVPFEPLPENEATKVRKDAEVREKTRLAAEAAREKEQRERVQAEEAAKRKAEEEAASGAAPAANARAASSAAKASAKRGKK